MGVQILAHVNVITMLTSPKYSYNLTFFKVYGDSMDRWKLATPILITPKASQGTFSNSICWSLAMNECMVKLCE